MPEMTGALPRLRYDRAGLRRRKDSGGIVDLVARKRNAPFGASGQRCYRWRGGRIFRCRRDVVKAFAAVRGPEGVPAETALDGLEETGMDIRIETVDPIHVARIRHVGPYSEVGPCIERLFRWAGGLGVPTGRVLTLSWDNPETAAPDVLRSDACVELRTEEEPPPGIELGPVGGGRYAVYRVTGSYDGFAQAYRRLSEEWLGSSGESKQERTCLEMYRDTPVNTPQEMLVTDLCLPVRAKKT